MIARKRKKKTTKIKTASFASSIFTHCVWSVGNSNGPLHEFQNLKYFRNPSRSAHSVNSGSSRWHRSNHRQGIIFSVTKQKIKKMAKNGTQLIEISPSSSERYSEEEEDNGTPLRPVFCVKRNADIKRIEEIEECFILDFDPFDSVDISKLSVSNSPIDNEVSVVAEKGQVWILNHTPISMIFSFLWWVFIFMHIGSFWFWLLRKCRTRKDPFFCCYWWNWMMGFLYFFAWSYHGMAALEIDCKLVMLTDIVSVSFVLLWQRVWLSFSVFI